MKKILLFLLVFSSTIAWAQQKKYVLVIHGGAGTILKKNMTPEKEKAYKAALEEALAAGEAILKKGGTAVDAVTAAVTILEDCPLFNAGKGSVFTNAGENEMDAAIMDGKRLQAGSVAGVKTIKNPITAARAVMYKSEHVMMTGRGAEAFAALQGCTIVSPNYFYTEERWKSLQKAKAEADTASRRIQSIIPDHAAVKQPGNRDYKYGTVGAVALDQYGNVAAATSTGGMTNKKYGRVGDAPIIGSGTYANNATCAVSCTGWGEYYIRLVMAKTISDRMEWGKQSLSTAATDMIMKQLPALGGDGGLIAVDKQGNYVMIFCTEGMYRGVITSDGKKEIGIYKE